MFFAIETIYITNEYDAHCGDDEKMPRAISDAVSEANCLCYQNR